MSGTYESYRDKDMMAFATALRETLDTADIEPDDEGYFSDGECLDFLYKFFKSNLLKYVPDEKLRNYLKERLDA